MRWSTHTAPGQIRTVGRDRGEQRLRVHSAARRWWARALTDAGLPADFKLHELRHTAASLAIRSGANVEALQNMLGHASAGLTLDRYGHLYDSDVDAVGHAIDAEIICNLWARCGHGAFRRPAPARGECR